MIMDMVDIILLENVFSTDKKLTFIHTKRIHQKAIVYLLLTYTKVWSRAAVLSQRMLRGELIFDQRS